VPASGVDGEARRGGGGEGSGEIRVVWALSFLALREWASSGGRPPWATSILLRPGLCGRAHFISRSFSVLSVDGGGPM
jgi:hypothetical protein